jgi:hypothetical protein
MKSLSVSESDKQHVWTKTSTRNFGSLQVRLRKTTEAVPWNLLQFPFIYVCTCPYLKYVLPRIYNFFIIILLSRVRLSPLGIAATTGLLYQPQMIDDGDCGAIGGMKIGRGNRSTRRKPAPAPLCPPQIPHDQTRARTWGAAVGSQQLTHTVDPSNFIYIWT